jgi:hypothetical protein
METRKNQGDKNIPIIIVTGVEEEECYQKKFKVVEIIEIFRRQFLDERMVDII